MNRRELVAALAERTETDKRTADAALQAFIDAVTETVATGEPVAISGFAKFARVDRAGAHGPEPPDRRGDPDQGVSTRAITPLKAFKDAVLTGKPGEEGREEGRAGQEGGGEARAAQEDRGEEDRGEEDLAALADSRALFARPRCGTTPKEAMVRRPRAARRRPAVDRGGDPRRVRGVRRRLLGGLRPGARVPVGLLPAHGGGRLGRHRAARGVRRRRPRHHRRRGDPARGGAQRGGDERLLGAAPHDLRLEPGREVRQRPAEGGVPAACGGG